MKTRATKRSPLIRRLQAAGVVLAAAALIGACGNEGISNPRSQYYTVRNYVTVTATVTSERFTMDDTVTVTVTVNNASGIPITVPDQICGAPFDLTIFGQPANPGYICQGERLKGGIAPPRGNFSFTANIPALLRAAGTTAPSYYGIAGRVRIDGDVLRSNFLSVELLDK